MEKMKVEYRGKVYENFCLKYNKGNLDIVEIMPEGNIYSAQPRKTIYTSIEKVTFIK